MSESHGIDRLGEEGIYSLQYPAGVREVVEDAVKAWKKFCSLPEEVRSKFPYYPEDGMGVGYELKKVTGATLDLKEDFHFTLSGYTKLLGQARNLDVPEIVEFVEKLNKLSCRLLLPVFTLSRDIEEAYSLQGLVEEISANCDNWYIRFLHYFGGSESGEEIAKAHADKSGFTFHLYESDPGLQYLDPHHKWRDVHVEEGKTVVLPGMRGQYRSKGKLRATFHRVVATPETAEHGRFSAVAFIHPDARTPRYDKVGKGRLQELKPGFNYTMPFEEFSKLFSK